MLRMKTRVPPLYGGSAITRVYTTTKPWCVVARKLRPFDPADIQIEAVDCRSTTSATWRSSKANAVVVARSASVQ